MKFVYAVFVFSLGALNSGATSAQSARCTQPIGHIGSILVYADIDAGGTGDITRENIQELADYYYENINAEENPLLTKLLDPKARLSSPREFIQYGYDLYCKGVKNLNSPSLEELVIIENVVAVKKASTAWYLALRAF
jgi:hypothetical protein